VINTEEPFFPQTTELFKKHRCKPLGMVIKVWMGVRLGFRDCIYFTKIYSKTQSQLPLSGTGDPRCIDTQREPAWYMGRNLAVYRRRIQSWANTPSLANLRLPTSATVLLTDVWNLHASFIVFCAHCVLSWDRILLCSPDWPKNSPSCLGLLSAGITGMSNPTILYILF
jgi:hypothetical protein